MWLYDDVRQHNGVDDAGTLPNAAVGADGDVGSDLGVGVDLRARMDADQTYDLLVRHRLRVRQNLLVYLVIVVQVDGLRVQQLLRLLHLLPEVLARVQLEQVSQPPLEQRTQHVLHCHLLRAVRYLEL